MGFINKTSDHFFFVELNSITKGKDKDGKEIMKFKGVASTADEDSQGEILDPNGFDFQPFLENGYINFHHQASKDPLANIGEPTKAYVKDNKFHIEGDLYSDNPIAQKVYQFANILSKNSKTRRLGLSIEGKAVEHDPTNPKKITKSIITGCAITHSPINKNTLMDIVKGVQNDSPPLFNDSDFSEFNTVIEKSTQHLDDDDDNDDILKMEDEDGELTVKKGYKIVLKKKNKDGDSIKKDLSTTTGKPMIKESLDHKMVDLTDSSLNNKKMIKSDNLSDIIKSDFPALSVEDVEQICLLVNRINNKETNVMSIISSDMLQKAYDSLGLSKGDAVVETAVKADDQIIKSDHVDTTPDPVVLSAEPVVAAVEAAIELDIDIIKSEISAQIGGLTASLQEKFTAVATIIKSMQDGFSAVERRFESVEQEPSATRKSITTLNDNLKFIEKSFDNGKLAASADENIILKATPQGRNKILGYLEKAAVEDVEKGDSILNKIISFESSGTLDDATVNYLNERYKVNIQ